MLISEISHIISYDICTRSLHLVRCTNSIQYYACGGSYAVVTLQHHDIMPSVVECILVLGVDAAVLG
jgi:hypothetical protein